MNLAELVMDFSYMAGSVVAVNGSIYTMRIKKPWIFEKHAKKKLKQEIEKHGIINYLTWNTLEGIAQGTLAAMGGYFIDIIFNAQYDMINVHHMVCYGGGSLLYTASGINLYGIFKK